LCIFSTVGWFLGGLALNSAANWFGRDARLTTGLFVGVLFLYGAVGNLLGDARGWMLMAVALAVIGFGVNKFGG